MSDLLFHYEQVDPTTWFYLSSLLIVGLFFKFNRAWSVRNLDLLLLILLGPGLLLQFQGSALRREGQQLEAAVAAVSVAREESSEDLADQVIGGKQAADKSDNDGTGPPPSDTAQPPDDTVQPPDDTVQPPDDTVQPPDDTVQPPEPDESAETDNGDDGRPPPSDERESRSASEITATQKIESGRSKELLGFIWLFAVGALLLVRMLFDPMMVRRPLLDPNLTSGGLIFISCALFVFLMANVISGTPTADDLTGSERAEAILSGKTDEPEDDSLTRHGPGLPILHMLPRLTTGAFVKNDKQLPEPQRQHTVNVITAKAVAVLANLAIVAGMVLIGYRHFDNFKMGIGAATLYLMMPYTAEMTGRVDHAIPAALLIWAVLCYRRPLTAGVFLGLAMGVSYYPLFLLPLWLSFYWQRGLMRFMVGTLATLAVIILMLIFTTSDLATFWRHFQPMFGLWFAKRDGLQGVWGLGWDPVFRLPVLATFFALAASFSLWPAQKNLGTLMSCSAALMIATQFWHGFGGGGGLFMGWYLPLLLLTVFRPNLEDRIALTVLGEGWFPRRRTDARPHDAEDNRAAMVARQQILPYQP